MICPNGTGVLPPKVLLKIEARCNGVERELCRDNRHPLRKSTSSAFLTTDKARNGMT